MAENLVLERHRMWVWEGKIQPDTVFFVSVVTNGSGAFLAERKSCSTEQ